MNPEHDFHLDNSAQTRHLGSVIRILDANANRATEGLRVVEEHLRFGRNDSALSETCKQIRHDVSRTVSACVPWEDRIACRSTDTDVGTQIQTDAEGTRTTVADVVTANLKRTTEALRALEEYSKLLSPVSSTSFEALRYRTYTLEKSMGHLHRAAGSLSSARLYVLIDGQFGFEEEFTRRLDTLLASHVDVVQLRAKGLTDRLLLQAARLVSERCRHANKLFIVNDRPDIAVLSQASGVHVGQDELTVADARMLVGPQLLIGVSTHSTEDAQRAVGDGADYIGVGPVFPSQTKHFSRYTGVDLLRSVQQTVSIPCFAIGGIDTSNVQEIRKAGMTRIAVSNAVWASSDPQSAANRLRDQLEN